MTNRIIYQIPGQPVAVMIPVIPQYIAPNVIAPVQLDIAQIGKKDVPYGVPFWIVSADEIPEDRSLRAAWTIDTDAMGEPDGYGGIQ